MEAFRSSSVKRDTYDDLATPQDPSQWYVEDPTFITNKWHSLDKQKDASTGKQLDDDQQECLIYQDNIKQCHQENKFNIC